MTCKVNGCERTAHARGMCNPHYLKWWRDQRSEEDARLANKAGVLRKFGLTIGEYQQIVEEQDGLCAVCRQPETADGRHGETKELAVDHDHETGEIRGLLCHRCNTALGLVNDDTKILRAMASYLEKDSGREQGGTMGAGGLEPSTSAL